MSLSLEPAEGDGAGDRRARMGAHFQGIEVIQSDIRLYPGNSGGPLSNSRGRVVGVNAMVGGGLGFSIPSRVVRQFLGDLEQRREPLYLGVEVLTVPLSPELRRQVPVDQDTAVLITAVEPESPAEIAGLLPGDALLALDGHSVRDARQLLRLLSQGATSGALRTLSILRGGQRVAVALAPVARKAA